MDFEQMKVIWDTQNAEPLYAINEADLRTVVRRRNDEINRSENHRYRFEIGVGFAFGILMLVLGALLARSDLGAARDGIAAVPAFAWVREPASLWEVAGLMTAGALWLYYGTYMLRVKRRQPEVKADFAAPLLAEVDTALARLAYQTHITRRVFANGFLPNWLAGILWVVVTFRLKGADPIHYAGVGVAFGAAFVLGKAYEHRRIAKRFEPRRHELEAIRQKLIDARR